MADCKNHRVQKFITDGKFLSKVGSHGSGDGQLRSPLDWPLVLMAWFMFAIMATIELSYSLRWVCMLVKLM